MNKKNIYRKILAASLVTTAMVPAWGAAPVWANDDEELTFEEVVVTARRRTESVQSIPESISVFGEELIQTAGIKDIADFSKLTPGAVVQQGFFGGDRPIVVFRGIGQIGGVAPSVIVLMDDVYLPAGDPLRHQFFDIERIEVLKGPQGSLYGRDTIGGVINVVSKRPENEISGSLSASGGSDNQFEIKGSIGGAIIEDELLFQLGARHYETDGFFVNTTGANQDFRNEDAIRGRLIWTPNEDTEITARIGYSTFRNGYNTGFLAADGDTFIDDVGGVLSVTDVNDGFNKRDSFEASLRAEFDLGWASLVSISQYVDTDQEIRSDGDFSFAPGLFVIRSAGLQEENFSQELRLVSPEDKSFRWITGVFYDKSDRLDTRLDEEFNLPLGVLADVSGSVETERMSAFAQMDLDVLDNLTASVALRYDKDDRTREQTLPVPETGELSFDEFSPKASLSYDITDDVMAYFTFGSGFRSGGFDASNGRPFGTEKLKSYEAGVKSTWADGRITLNAAAYYIDYTDQQVAVVITDPDSGLLITTTQNLGASRTKGFEVELQTVPFENFSLNIGFDTMNSKIEDDPDATVIGNQTPFRTSYTVNTSAQYYLPIADDYALISRVDWYRQGRQIWNKQNTLSQDPYDLVNLNVIFQADGWSIDASVENLFDQEYNDQLFDLGGISFVYPGLPRRWRVGATFNF